MNKLSLSCQFEQWPVFLVTEKTRMSQAGTLQQIQSVMPLELFA
jgi:hypothetical protein